MPESIGDGGTERFLSRFDFTAIILRCRPGDIPEDRLPAELPAGLRLNHQCVGLDLSDAKLPDVILNVRLEVSG